MANKYLRHGETYCGDGTTSAAATSNGGVGAWNTITYFEGTTPAYGTLAAGDVVYIRSKDAGGADISIAKSAAALYLGAASAVATEANPIRWVIDAGDVWSGISGTITYTMSTNNIIYIRDFNNVNAGDKKLILVNTFSTFASGPWFNTGKTNTVGLKLDNQAQTGSLGGSVEVAEGTHVNLHVVTKHANDSVIKHIGPSNDVVLINPTLECLTPPTPAYANALFHTSQNYAGSLVVFGGQAIGAGLHDARIIYKGLANEGQVSFYGFKYPRNVALSSPAAMTSHTQVFANGGDGMVGNAYWDYFYAYDSRDDGYYPTLNATLETSVNDGWSYKVYPFRTTKQKPARVAVSKMYTQAAAIKTITFDLLWPVSMAAPKNSVVHIGVAYTDATTGEKKYVSSLSMADATLSTSTAAWSATTYGATLFDKYKIEVTTPTTIKQDTEIMLVFMSSPKSATSNDILFVDPDFTLT